MATSLNIVLVEDHDSLRDVTADVLRQSGHQVIALSCAEDMEDKVGGRAVDLFILDLNLPGEDGISLARRLRRAHPTVGIIMVTARNRPQDLTIGYAEGADMYLMKPVEVETLLAAVESISRRLSQTPADTGLCLKKDTLRLIGPSGSVTVQAIEADLLTAFARAPERRLETWQLAELFGNEDSGFSKSGIEVRITRLRKKLIACGASQSCIKSIRAIGYQFCDSLLIV